MSDWTGMTQEETIEQLGEALVASERDYKAAHDEAERLCAALASERQAREAAERERDELRAVLASRHGGEPIALLSELDEARRQRDVLNTDMAAARRDAEALREALTLIRDSLVEETGANAPYVMAIHVSHRIAVEALSTPSKKED